MATRSRQERTGTHTQRKRCAKCGVMGWYAPREVRCKQLERNAMGKTGYACWGRLARMADEPLLPKVAPPREQAPAPTPQQVAAERAAGMRERAAQRRADVEGLLATAVRKQREARKLDVRAALLEKRAAMTDAELAADRDRRRAAAAKGRGKGRVRGIRLT